MKLFFLRAHTRAEEEKATVSRAVGSSCYSWL